jgi:hypothetical protein
MAVLVQRVVPAQYAYVIHTRNPSNNDPNEIFCELVRGLGGYLGILVCGCVCVCARVCVCVAVGLCECVAVGMGTMVCVEVFAQMCACLASLWSACS